jgi:hypothetical protein
VAGTKNLPDSAEEWQVFREQINKEPEMRMKFKERE